MDASAKRRAARDEVRRDAMSKNAAKDAIQILSALSDGRPPSFRQLFSPSHSSLSVTDDVRHSEVVHVASNNEGNQILQESDSELHGASSPAIILSGVDEITSTLENTMNEITAVSREGTQMQQSELHSPVITLVEVDDTSSSNNIIINKELTAVEREQGGIEAGASEANQPVARRRRWLGRWRKGTQEPSKLSSAEQAHVIMTDIPMEVPKLSLAKLREKTDNFRVKYLLGDDSLYLGSESKDIAQIEEKFLTKVSRLFALKHENIVNMVGYCTERNNCILAYEFATRGSFHHILYGTKGVRDAKSGPVLSWMQRARIAVDVAKGLEYLHEKVQRSIIHGHIRSSDVLWFEDYKAKIRDLSISNQSTYIDEDFHEILIRVPNCSHDYFPPEYYFPEPVEALNDPLYYYAYPNNRKQSFGVILLELLTGRKPGPMSRGQRSLVNWAKPRLSENRVKDCVDPRLKGEYPPKGVAKLAAVAALCLEYEPARRLSMSIVVKAFSPHLAEKPDDAPADII